MPADAISRSKLSLHAGSGGEFWIWRVLPNGDVLSTIGPFRDRISAEIALVELGGTRSRRNRTSKRGKRLSLGVGTRVEGGRRGSEDHDAGRVIAIAGDAITVAWDSGVTTTQPSSLIRAEK